MNKIPLAQPILPTLVRVEEEELALHTTEHKGCGSIVDLYTSARPTVHPKRGSSAAMPIPHLCANPTLVLHHISLLLANPQTLHLMQQEGIRYRTIPGKEKDCTETPPDGVYPNLILERSVLKIQRYLREEIEHSEHPFFDDLDALYFIPVINVLFLKIQSIPKLQAGDLCLSCQNHQIQKFIDCAVVQIVISVASMIFIPAWISISFIFWNAIWIFLEDKQSSRFLAARTFSQEEKEFISYLGKYPQDAFVKMLHSHSVEAAHSPDCAL